jgi:hypothetical protein
LNNSLRNLDDIGRNSPKSISSSCSSSPSSSENSPSGTPVHRSNKRKTGFKSNPKPLLSLSKTLSEDRAEKRRIVYDFYALKNSSGHQYSQENNQLFITQINGLMIQEEYTMHQAVQLISKISGAHYQTISNVYNEYKNNKIIHSPDTSKMGSGNPSHPFYQHEWSLEIEQQIHHIIEEHNKTKGFCNTNDIRIF